MKSRTRSPQSSSRRNGLRRRYGKKVAEGDTEVFDQCVDTIIRQVGDIGQMVDEFSSFARMPKPTLEMSDLVRDRRTDHIHDAGWLPRYYVHNRHEGQTGSRPV
jgi:hypothetical protein